MVAATIQSTKKESAILRKSGIAAVPCSRNFTHGAWPVSLFPV
jgi:hypothetical protein